jgi:phosphomevalonate decarboxylase
MTGDKEMMLWRPETVQVMLKVRKLREQNVPAFFSIDTGATVYVNTFPDRAEDVQREIQGLGLETIRCWVGGPARLSDEHLF